MAQGQRNVAKIMMDRQLFELHQPILANFLLVRCTTSYRIWITVDILTIVHDSQTDAGPLAKEV
jgi:hypothetical protein